MAIPSTKTVGDAMLRETEAEVTAVLVHLKKLLRVRNQYCSPLLRLPIEIITHVLSFVMENMGSYPAWHEIFATCYRIRRIMYHATSLWWEMNISLGRQAEVVLTRSEGNPRAVVAQFTPWDEWETITRESVLVHWRDQWELQGRQLHTLAFYGTPSSLPRFSWVFKIALPCLEHLKFHVVSGIRDDIVSGPVAFQLPTNPPLRVLDLRNATLPWSSHFFIGLSELHLDFGDVTVSMTEDELLKILDASPQLERLSLVQIRQTIPSNGHWQLPPKRVVRLPVLTFLKLDNDPGIVGYTLACVDTPALASLEIRSRVSDWDPARSLDYFFPDNRLPRRVFSDPPVLEVARPYPYERTPSLEFSIGSFKVQFDFNDGDLQASHDATAACFRLVPPSVTTLKFELAKLDVQEWKEFLLWHPEVRSIEWTDLQGDPVSESFWDALSPTEDNDPFILCPRLEYILVNEYSNTEQLKPLLVSLCHRGCAGFKLRRLKITESREWVYTIAGVVRQLVEVLEINYPSKSKQRVSSVLTDRPGMY